MYGTVRMSHTYKHTASTSQVKSIGLNSRWCRAQCTGSSRTTINMQ